MSIREVAKKKRKRFYEFAQSFVRQQEAKARNHDLSSRAPAPAEAMLRRILDAAASNRLRQPEWKERYIIDEAGHLQTIEIMDRMHEQSAGAG